MRWRSSHTWWVGLGLAYHEQYGVADADGWDLGRNGKADHRSEQRNITFPSRITAASFDWEGGGTLVGLGGGMCFDRWTRIIRGFSRSSISPCWFLMKRKGKERGNSRCKRGANSEGKWNQNQIKARCSLAVGFSDFPHPLSTFR